MNGRWGAGRNHFEVDVHFGFVLRVANIEQPWAGGRNPVGIDRQTGLTPIGIGAWDEIVGLLH